MSNVGQDTSYKETYRKAIEELVKKRVFLDEETIEAETVFHVNELGHSYKSPRSVEELCLEHGLITTATSSPVVQHLTEHCNPKSRCHLISGMVNYGGTVTNQLVQEGPKLLTIVDSDEHSNIKTARLSIIPSEPLIADAKPNFEGDHSAMQTNNLDITNDTFHQLTKESALISLLTGNNSSISVNNKQLRRQLLIESRQLNSDQAQQIQETRKAPKWKKFFSFFKK